MASIRPEVLEFLEAAKALLPSDANTLQPLSDHELEQVVDCLARVEAALQDGEI